MTSMKRTTIPRSDTETVRQGILALLEDGFARTALEISSAVRIPEREVVDHLVHLEKTLRARGSKLIRLPAECLSCGFVFRKREKIAGPGKCPLCKGEFISRPSFRVEIRAAEVYNSADHSIRLEGKENK